MALSTDLIDGAPFTSDVMGCGTDACASAPLVRDCTAAVEVPEGEDPVAVALYLAEVDPTGARCPAAFDRRLSTRASWSRPR